MPSLYFDKRYTDVVNALYDDKDKITGKGVFDSLWQLMIFLAMVGRQKEKNFTKMQRLEAKNRVREIKESIFEQTNKDGFVYLLAIDQDQSGEILREGNEDKIWQYLEISAAVGIKEVKSWLTENHQLHPRDVILTKIKETAQRNLSGETETFKPPVF